MSERIGNKTTIAMPTLRRPALECELPLPRGDHQTEKEDARPQKVQSSNQKNKSSKLVVLTPLSLLALAACRSGGTDAGDGADDGLNSLLGRVVKGPLENAFVFADINSNGSFDLGEPSSTTDSDGRFTLEGAGAATIIATTSANTIDQSSGVALDGLTLTAPAGATVVTPVTSIIAQSGGALTPTQVAQILGLPAGVDPLEYDPYAQGTDNAEAARVEVIAQQLVATVRSFAAVAEGTGVTEDEAMSAAFSAVVQLVTSKGADGATELVDFTSAEDISAISQAVAGNLLALDEQGDRNLNTDLFDDLADVTSSALINVNAVIDTTVTQVVETGGSLSSDEVKNALSTTQVLQQQLEEASQAEAEAPGSGSQSVVFSDVERVSEAVQNAAPVSISLSNTEILENAEDLFIGKLSAVDDADLPTSAFSIVKHGTHWQYFEIRNDDELFLKQAADFETTPEFNILVDVTDAGGKTLRKSFTITVTDVNDAPVGAVTITGTATQGEVLTADTSTLADDDGLGTFNYQWKANGTTISGATGSTYTLTQAEVGKVITIAVSYTDGGSTVETVESSATGTVQNVNDAPVGAADTMAASEDTAVTYAAAELLGNDTDADGNTLSIKSVTAITGGTVVLNDNNTVTFTPTANFNGAASFSYIATDGTADSAATTVTVNVAAVNDAPVGVADTLAATEDTAVTYDAVDLLGNDTDADGNTLSIKSVTAITGGTAVLNQDGTVTFTPMANFNGAASFSYIATDGTADTAATTVTVNVAAVNDAPVGVADTLVATEDTAVTYDAVDLLGNDTDADGNTLSIKSVNSITGGTALLNQDGTVTLTPTANFNGAASFSYIATDGTADTEATTVTVNIAEVNDAPVIVSVATGSVAENAASSTVIYTAQASDVDTGTTLTYSLSGADASLLDIDSSTGAVTLKASANFEVKSSYSFNVIATDNGTGGLSGTKAVSVSVTDVNEAPSITSGATASFAENGTGAVYTATATDPDASTTLTYTLGGTDANLFDIDASTGVVTFKSAPNFEAPADAGANNVYNITVTTTDDGTGSLSDTKAVAITVTNVNDAPVAVADTLTATEDTAVTFTAADLLGNDSDADGDTLSSRSVTSGTGGTAVLNQDGTITFTPTANFNGAASFSYIATDGTADSADTTVTVNVAAVNDAPVGNVTISGTPKEGQTLIANNTLADADGLGTLAYTWKAGGVAIVGATASTYTLTQAEVGKAITVEISYTDREGTLETIASTATVTVANVNDIPTGEVTITGTASEGDVLTANTSALVDADGLGTLSYQWKANGSDIAGATDSTYTLTQDEVGKVITVAVSYIDDEGTSESVISQETSIVGAQNQPPIGDVLINSRFWPFELNPIQGDTLEIDTSPISDPDGLGPFSYQWIAGGVALEGATASTLLLTQEHVGKSITAIVSYTDQKGKLEIISGQGAVATTAPVQNINDAPTGNVTITGDATEDEVLTVDTSALLDPDGFGEFSYQWKADGNDIAGATERTFTLTQDEVGKVITVAVSYTDGGGAEEKVLSAATSAVESVNAADTTAPFLLIGDGGDSGWPAVIDPSWTFNYEDDYVGLDAIDEITAAFSDPNSVLSQGYTDDPTATITIELRALDAGSSFTTRTYQITPEQVSGVLAPKLTDDSPLYAYSLTVGQSGLTANDLVSGEYLETVTATDAAGNTNSISYKIIFDFEAPDAPSFNTFMGDDVLTVDELSSLVFSGQAEAGSAVSLQIEDDPYGPVTVVASESGTWSVTGAQLQLTQVSDFPPDGTYKILATATDKAGNQSEIAQKTITIDLATSNVSGTATIVGTVRQGEVLTVDTSALLDPDGFGEFSYQWKADGNDIAGATERTFTLTQ
ncbi:tandem-95 repeat protein, partial [Rhodobacteraceae bacterium XHP0102]|nr:tandem-95 repeat protein [Rhodobacteraceae bacterium XHP0102]